MSNIRQLLADLGGGGATDVVMTPEAEDRAARAIRQALGEMLAGKPKDREAALAVHAKYLLGRPIPARDKALLRGLRRLRSFREVQAAIREGQPVFRFPDPASPGRGWVTVEEAARITGYSEDHIRGWVLREHPEIQRRIWQGKLYVRKRDITRYARRQRKRGYGPRN